MYPTTSPPLRKGGFRRDLLMIYLFYQKSSMARNPSHSVKYQKGLKKPLAFNFQDKMKKALAKRHLGKALIGTIALKAISDFFLEK